MGWILVVGATAVERNAAGLTGSGDERPLETAGGAVRVDLVDVSARVSSPRAPGRA
jgi:hypothetical protein